MASGPAQLFPMTTQYFD